MIFSKRDFNLVMITLAVLLGGLTYLLIMPMANQWKLSSAAREQLERDRALADRILASRPEWEERLGALQATLPTYGLTEAVGAELLRQVRRLADENRVITTRITPDTENNIGNLYEQAIEVTWEAELEPLVRFLYAVQIAGATLDIRTMTMTPSQEQSLKGNLKIFFAYQRLPDEPEKESGGQP
jgi:hypothetical protein